MHRYKVKRLAFSATSSVNDRRANFGAAMVETVLAIPLFLLILAVIIDGGMYMYQLLRVTHITNQVSREMASTAAVKTIALHTKQKCTDVRDFACEAIEQVYDSQRDAMLKGVEIEIINVAPNPWGGLPLLVVEGSLSRSCIACFFLPSSFQARARSLIALELEGSLIPCAGGDLPHKCE